MIDVRELHRLWAETDTPLRLIADRFRTTPGTIAGFIRRRRKIEGTARWPIRPSVATVKPDKTRTIKRAGTSTLPPLDSLR